MVLGESLHLITNSNSFFCSEPTPLDALAFAYLHCILNSTEDNLRAEVSRRVNLVAWEKKISEIVNAPFTLG